MDSWQTIQQIRYLVRAEKWADSPADEVFETNQVIITQGVDERLITEVRHPSAWIVDQGADLDPENPAIERRSYQISAMVVQMGDRFGTAAVLGANRLTSTGSSISRGILEISDKVLSALEILGEQDGIQQIALSRGVASPVAVVGSKVILQIDHTLEATIENVRSYPPVSSLAGSVSAPNVNLSWTDPPARFDSFNITVERGSGSSSFARGAGTLVSDPALAAESATDAPGSGTWTYGVWGGFDEDGSGARDHFSSYGSEDLGAFVTVTVP